MKLWSDELGWKSNHLDLDFMPYFRFFMPSFLCSIARSIFSVAFLPFQLSLVPPFNLLNNSHHQQCILPKLKFSLKSHLVLTTTHYHSRRSQTEHILSLFLRCDANHKATGHRADITGSPSTSGGSFLVPLFYFLS
jgi:hypothetical protein